MLQNTIHTLQNAIITILQSFNSAKCNHKQVKLLSKNLCIEYLDVVSLTTLETRIKHQKCTYKPLPLNTKYF